jgi:8-oxo-dGTP diphosphatase
LSLIHNHMGHKEYCYKYPRPAVSTDCVVLSFDGDDMNVLLIERGGEPFKGWWALPGGFLQMDESADDGARRELYEETGIRGVDPEQLYTFSKPDRDPRGRTISIAYLAVVRTSDYEINAADDAASLKWFRFRDVPKLAFDHNEILKLAFEKIIIKLKNTPAAFDLLNIKFTFGQLQKVYESILNIVFDRRNFRRKMMKTGLLVRLDEKMENVSHRAPGLMMFDYNKYRNLRSKGQIPEFY